MYKCDECGHEFEVPFNGTKEETPGCLTMYAGCYECGCGQYHKLKQEAANYSIDARCQNCSADARVTLSKGVPLDHSKIICGHCGCFMDGTPNKNDQS